MENFTYELLTIKEARVFIKVHPETSSRWYLKLGLHGLKVDKTLRFGKEDLITFLEKNKS